MGQAAHASHILRGRTCFMLIEGQDGCLSLSAHHHDVDDLATLVCGTLRLGRARVPHIGL